MLAHQLNGKTAAKKSPHLPLPLKLVFILGFIFVALFFTVRKIIK